MITAINKRKREKAKYTNAYKENYKKENVLFECKR